MFLPAVALLTAISSSAARAAQLEEPILLGHNLTPTTYVLKKGNATAGTYALGYGITDDWMAGMSPFITVGYGMFMIETRYRFLNRDGFEATAEGMYFHTFPGARYDQQSMFLRLTGSRRFSELYTLHASFGQQYFWNDRLPFSLNPWPGLRKYIPSVSTLHEFRVFSLFGVMLEAGVLALNYPAPERHVGISGFYKNTWLLIQVGVSETRSLHRDDYGIIHWKTHPEIMVQTYFTL